MDKLEDFHSKPEILEEIQGAIQKGLDKVKIYYRLSDNSNMYPIATGKFLITYFMLYLKY